MHTQADEILEEHPTEGDAGKHTLLTILRVNNEVLVAFNSIAAQNRELVKGNYGGDWSVRFGFAEDVVRRFALEKGQFAHLFAVETSVNDRTYAVDRIKSRIFTQSVKG